MTGELWCAIVACLMKLRENFRSHPVLEPLGRFSFATKDEGVHAGLVDDDHVSVLTWVDDFPVQFILTQNMLPYNLSTIAEL